MAVMTGLQLNVGQNLKLTPQLQQSIKILQYSALEVQQTIEATLEHNFMLEVADNQDELLDEDFEVEALQEASDSSDASLDDVTENVLDIENATELSSDLDLDCDWQDIYGDEPSTQIEDAPLQTFDNLPSQSTASSEDYTAAENYTAAEESLHDRLHWQADIYPWVSPQEVIADFIIDQVNEEGFLSVSLEQILEALQAQYPELTTVTLCEVEETLAIVQQFEPTGVAARSLQETLLIQLNAQPPSPYVVTAKQIIQNHFDWLSEHDYKRIKKYYALSEADLDQLLALIQNLNPRPGREFSSVDQSLVVPDLLLYRTETGWRVELNQNIFPKLTINKAYIDLSKQVTDEKQSLQIKEHLLEAKGLIKSIHSRGETILRVGQYIVEAQAQFFEEGERAMQPLVLRDVAEALDLHESTISRATSQKYIQTPRGTYELKYFFSTGVSQYGSEDQSSIAIKSHIKELIQQEDPQKPLSDNKLAKLLEERDITVARRTIAKYREALNIPSSSERKKLHALRR